MFGRLLQTQTDPPSSRSAPRARLGAHPVLTALVAVLFTAFALAVPTAYAAVDRAQESAAPQVLTWTAGNDYTKYTSAPVTAVAGEATIVFESSAATGNTTGLSHTLTFDTSNPDYNNDVSLNILASPFDSAGGRHTATVTLTPGVYRYFCAMPGHQMMAGELVVTAGPGGEDTTAPDTSATVSGTKDDAGDYVDTTTVTLTASDTDSGVDTIEYTLDNNPYTPYSNPITINTPGTHTLTYRATDNAGNTSPEKTLTLTITTPQPPKDTTPPDTSATVSGTKDDTGNYIDTATVTLTASDTDSGVDTIEYTLDNNPYTPYTNPITINTPGTHTLTYRATDNAGNTSEARSVTFTVVAAPPVDGTPPQVSASVTGTKNDAGDYVGGATVTVTASDAESGVARIEYSLDGGPYLRYSAPVSIDRAGSHTLLYRASDEAGNTSTAQSLSLTVVDAEPPTDCPEPDDRSTVFTGSVDTGVPNRVTGNGCTINELIEDHRAWKNHGAFVSHVGEIVTALRKEGVVDQREAAAIKKAAGRSEVGMPDDGTAVH
ncbi:cupredoxin domain-containing protein [Streptomyces salinarius]|uniref:cupredoxin domain-containing protein n=1 Tax=Streptomyces salinarius TaxID=2762598 RepID=UPI0028F72E2C|nr:plastocyanin/azurin family copper-binding protein [Streptomyces salinarius]